MEAILQRIPQYVRYQPGDACLKCRWLLEEGWGFPEVVEDHRSRCHGYLHCGAECCGSCPYCGK